MSKQTPTTDAQSEKKDRPKAELVPMTEVVGELAGLAQLPGGPISAAGDGSIQRQAARLMNSRLQTVQRQALAAQIGRVQGNRHLQRVMTTVQRDDSQKQQTKVQKLDELLDKLNVPEEEVITLLGQLDQAEKNEVLSPGKGYKRKLGEALNVEEMIKAINNLTIGPFNPTLKTKLEWLQAADSASSIDYAQIKSWIVSPSTTAEQKNELRNDTWRTFFAGVCTNETMPEALKDLGFELGYKIRWMAAEMDLSYDDVKRMITDPKTSADEKKALQNDTWRDYFVSLCTNETMAKLVNDLGFDLATKLDWMIAEGTNLELVAAAIRTASDAELTGVTGKPELMKRLQAELGDSDFKTANRMLTQGLLVEETDMKRDLKETLLVGNPTTEAFTEREFGGTAGFDLAYYRDRLQITVRVALKPTDDTARTQLATVQPLWKTNIEAAWNKFKVTNPVRTLPVKVDCIFTNSNPHHEVNVYPGVPTKWPGVDMTNWYTGNLIAPNHEFGHMLGNPDEYFRSAEHFKEVTGIDPTTAPPGTVTSQTDTAGKTRYANPSAIMGVSSQPAQPRHLNYFLNWINKHRRPGEPPFTLI